MPKRRERRGARGGGGPDPWAAGQRLALQQRRLLGWLQRFPPRVLRCVAAAVPARNRSATTFTASDSTTGLIAAWYVARALREAMHDPIIRLTANVHVPSQCDGRQM